MRARIHQEEELKEGEEANDDNERMLRAVSDFSRISFGFEFPPVDRSGFRICFYCVGHPVSR